MEAASSCWGSRLTDRLLVWIRYPFGINSGRLLLLLMLLLADDLEGRAFECPSGGCGGRKDVARGCFPPTEPLEMDTALPGFAGTSESILLSSFKWLVKEWHPSSCSLFSAESFSSMEGPLLLRGSLTDLLILSIGRPWFSSINGKDISLSADDSDDKGCDGTWLLILLSTPLFPKSLLVGSFLVVKLNDLPELFMASEEGMLLAVCWTWKGFWWWWSWEEMGGERGPEAVTPAWVWSMRAAEEEAVLFLPGMILPSW